MLRQASLKLTLMSQSTRSSVDREYGGVSLPPVHERSSIVHGTLREATNNSTSNMQENSMVERFQDVGIEESGRAADHKTSEVHLREISRIGRPSTPKLSHTQAGQGISDSYVESYPRQERAHRGYGNIGSPIRKITGSSNPIAQNLSDQNNSNGKQGHVVFSNSLTEEPSQPFFQPPKIDLPPVVQGAASWNDSVWDNHWLHRPEAAYTRQPDRNSVITVSPKASIDDANLYENYSRPHTVQALADHFRQVSQDEIRHNGLNSRTEAVQVYREQAINEGFAGMTDLMTKQACNRHAQRDWIERSDLMARYARLMGDDL